MVTICTTCFKNLRFAYKLYSIYRFCKIQCKHLMVVMETRCVFFDVRTECLNNVKMSLVFRMLISSVPSLWWMSAADGKSGGIHRCVIIACYFPNILFSCRSGLDLVIPPPPVWRFIFRFLPHTKCGTLSPHLLGASHLHSERVAPIPARQYFTCEQVASRTFIFTVWDSVPYNSVPRRRTRPVPWATRLMNVLFEVLVFFFCVSKRMSG
jgi:hypothetical protein